MSSPTWLGDGTYPTYDKITIWGWIRVVVRGLLVLFFLFGGAATIFLIRLIEKPFFGFSRPWSGYIPSFVCRMSILSMGIKFKVRGTKMKTAGAVVANHSSWLDILTLNAADQVFFVSKSEVANWFGIGWLAKTVGSVFINRDPREAQSQKDLFEERLTAGQRLLFFPEGTSTDNMCVLPFKSTLFAAFFSDQLKPLMHIQAATVNYIAPEGQDPRFYGWWGDMEFEPHMLQMLAARKHGTFEVVFHEPVAVSDFKNRKTLSLEMESRVRSAHHRSDA